MRRSGFTLLEMIIAMVITVMVLGAAMKTFSSSSQFSEKINMEQMIDQESQRLLTVLQADCRSAKSIQAHGEALEIVRYGFDAGNNVQETVVSYVFVDGNMIRQENGKMKTFEFKRWQDKQPTDLECLFALASPAVLCLKVSVKHSGKSLIDKRVVYETTSK